VPQAGASGPALNDHLTAPRVDGHHNGFAAKLTTHAVDNGRISYSSGAQNHPVCADLKQISDVFIGANPAANLDKRVEFC